MKKQRLINTMSDCSINFIKKDNIQTFNLERIATSQKHEDKLKQKISQFTLLDYICSWRIL